MSRLRRRLHASKVLRKVLSMTCMTCESYVDISRLCRNWRLPFASNMLLVWCKECNQTVLWHAWLRGQLEPNVASQAIMTECSERYTHCSPASLQNTPNAYTECKLKRSDVSEQPTMTQDCMICHRFAKRWRGRPQNVIVRQRSDVRCQPARRSFNSLRFFYTVTVIYVVYNIQALRIYRLNELSTIGLFNVVTLYWRSSRVLLG
jgi:hypothetical protein